MPPSHPYRGTTSNPTAATIASAASNHGISGEPLLDGPDGQLDAIAQAEPAEDGRDVSGDDVLADLQPRGDLAVRQALADQDNHSAVVIRKRITHQRHQARQT